MPMYASHMSVLFSEGGGEGILVGKYTKIISIQAKVAFLSWRLNILAVSQGCLSTIVGDGVVVYCRVTPPHPHLNMLFGLSSGLLQAIYAPA